MLTIEQFDNLSSEEKLNYLLKNYSSLLNLSVAIIDELVSQKNLLKNENEHLKQYFKYPFDALIIDN